MQIFLHGSDLAAVSIAAGMFRRGQRCLGQAWSRLMLITALLATWPFGRQIAHVTVASIIRTVGFSSRWTAEDQ